MMSTENAITVINGKMLEVVCELEICKSDKRKQRLEEEYRMLTTAKDALELRRPEKVVVERISEDLQLRNCPRCNVRFIAWGMKFCGECGQALNWEMDDGKEISKP